MKIKELIEKFTYRVEWSEDDKAHIAYALEMPGVKAHADSSVEALVEVRVPLEMALQDMLDNRETLPEPLSMQNFKGNLTVRTTPDKHREIAIRAVESGVSINQYILSKIG